MAKTEYNIEKLVEIINSYSFSTGVDMRVVDSSGNTLHLSCVSDACSLCNTANEKTGGKCIKTHHYGCIQSDRFGGKYVFFCHMGLTHWVTPLYRDGELNGGVVAGPVTMVNPEDMTQEEYRHIGSIVDNPEEAHNTIPVKSPKEVDALSHLLYFSVFSKRFEDSATAMALQSDIGQYMQHLKTMGGTGADSYPLDKENKLITMISLGDKNGAQRVLSEILAHTFFSTGAKFELIKARVLELVVVLSRAALHGGADPNQIFGMNYTYLNQINSFTSVEQLTLWMSRIIDKFTECVFDLQDVKHIDVIYKSIEYIRRNYMKKVTLDEVSENVALSPSYFSRIFKKEMKTSFNSYLNSVRIEMSKKLLFDEDIPLSDIAMLVGFEHQSYYSKIFKQNTGISPRQYREKRRSH
jgi:AraC-like DNA-binding protein/ligand-binding sensor protein